MKRKVHEEDAELAEISSLEDICFRDKRTSRMCKAWLFLQASRALTVDILFPASEFDCRLTIGTSK